MLVIGAGPAGVSAALRAGALGARTALVTRGAFGGMAANDGPVPVRTLAHAARLLREARQMGAYGIEVGEPTLDYRRLLARAGEVVQEVRSHSALRGQLEAAGVVIHEHAGVARFVDAKSVETERGHRLRAGRIILCTGGVSRKLAVPGSELTETHSDAWALTSVPESMLVIGAGATGVQVASVFGAFGSRVDLFQRADRILTTEDADVSAAVAAAFRASGIGVHEGFGNIERFEQTPGGVRMTYSKDGVRQSAEASLAVIAVGWVADTSALNPGAAGVELDARGFVRVDSHLRTSAPGIYAAGDITGQMMLVPQALQAGFVAATNAVRGDVEELGNPVSPIGSFTDPEYAQVGLTEAQARAAGHDVVVAVAGFDASTRPIIDGRPAGFCKLVVHRARREVLGCHVVGERAVDLCQVAAIVIASNMKVSELARLPLSFPTYAGILGLAAARAAHALGLGAREEVDALGV
ncbi:dihydrolipoyl dehydrogenase family protein [Pyxidicoccus parkwayensis]|uniref:dihydrolipoyl dehydrogenase family protein n=1 Tax=Pyxidicoccus parkwayensis TaxID=2813578 RepID=UPI001F50C099|nr:NAD(P)/FAD-dependent oxidoreductase [Pyxidicoccus parkwaysis]